MQVMQYITAAVLAAFVGYIGAWYLGALEGNFALLLFLATVVTGAYWLAERLYFLPRRRQAAQALEAAAAQRRAELDRMGIQKVDQADLQEAQGRILMQPWWLDWTAGLFPVIAIVFVLRSFLFEPFKIPSGSMIPTLLVGDLILVNKFTYGLRLPVINTKITQGSPLQRGDVVVFRYPPQPSMDYIKRVVGVPGDEVAYLNKRLTVNGKPVETTALPDFFDRDAMRYFQQFDEQLGEHRHRILNTAEVPAFVQGASNYPFRDQCRYSVEGVTCTVPQGHYFMMGDNRDNSLDSRYWGFVPDENIVGKAFFVWMNFGDFKRIGAFN
ncbi:signal peptidase I [Diaphorobacter sp. MNS-0]|uniref:signal peptidase I n=1 Tax=Diaphorobacter sp. MNS-0 TaxID=2866628 RepID=UPI001C73246F|nr:signal peptidase I [Diaphorobacter sp. MNS-0]QYY24804.1 signal peptidase I [Diaphorobacter sp. MNS-0]